MGNRRKTLRSAPAQHGTGRTRPGGVARLLERIEVAAYYMVSEALTNTAKHAHASVIQVQATAVPPAAPVASGAECITWLNEPPTAQS
jgi:anti-sigma regulatory factor (Ser/Thr protein kinase)